MEEPYKDDEDFSTVNRQIFGFMLVVSAIVGLSEQGLLTMIGSVAIAIISFVVGTRWWQMAIALIVLAIGSLLLPVFHSLSLATVFGSTTGWVVRKLADRDIVGRRLAFELEQKKREASSSQLELLKSDEMNRYLLAADLHDQALNDQKALAESVRSHKNSFHSSKYDQVQQKLTEVMTETRDIMDRLYPAQINMIGLTESLDALLSRMCRAHGLKPRFREKTAPNSVQAFNELERIVIYRIAEEAIANACRHAQATTVSVDVETIGRELVISIRDDGKGIDKAQFLTPGRGLKFIMVRADVIGAIVGWTEGKSGTGTECELRVSLPEPEPVLERSAS